MKMKLLSALFVTAALLSVNTQALETGSLVPALKVDTLKNYGKPSIDLNQMVGKVVYLDFWASWCTPCRKSFPWMNAMQKQYGKYGFEVVAINLDEDRELANQFLKQTPANFTIAFDPTGQTAESYSVDVMPSSFLIDRKGEPVAIHKGFRKVDSAALEKEIRQLLARK